MKVTRLAHGFRLACNDSEFELLRLTVERGLAELSGSPDQASLSLPIRLVLRSERFRNLDDPLRIDVDRREAASARHPAYPTTLTVAEPTC